MHPPKTTASTPTNLSSCPQSGWTEFLEDSDKVDWNTVNASNMACKSNTTSNNLKSSSRRKPEACSEDLVSLRPRPRASLYPTIPDFDINLDNHDQAWDWEEDTSNSTSDLDKKPSALSSASTLATLSTVSTCTNNDDWRRSSVTSQQTLPSDCSAEDLQAIQAALYEDEAEQDEASMALVQKLMREEVDSDALSVKIIRTSEPKNPEPEAEAENSPQAISSGIAQDLIYQLCLRLDEVNIDVKSENWQMLAPHVIDQLPLVCYECNSNSDNHQEKQCLVCLTEYEQGEHLRKLPKCGHSFHQACVDPWLLKHDWCPVCRATIDD